MMDIVEYMKFSREERRAHLKLNESCIERGGYSTLFRALLAQHLDTTIPIKAGKRILCCHACNNAACSNPNHLYWGTDADNSLDAFAAGRKVTPYQADINKHGVAVVKERQKACGKKFGAFGGMAGKGKPKSDQHKQRLSIAQIGKKKHSADGNWHTSGT